MNILYQGVFSKISAFCTVGTQVFVSDTLNQDFKNSTFDEHLIYKETYQQPTSSCIKLTNLLPYFHLM